MRANSEIITKLLTNKLPLAAQCDFIAELSKGMFSADVLYEVVKTIRNHELALSELPADTIDILGTGGDGANTLNFSTISALVLADMGVKIAKHGNVSVTSKCGSFDLLKRLGVDIPENPASAYKVFQHNGVVFLFAPFFHPAFKYLAEARKTCAAKKQKTIFNVLGPLLNPAHVTRIVTGVYDPKLIKPYAETLQKLGVEFAYIVHGNGLDEASLTGKTCYAKIHQGNISYGVWEPSDFALLTCDLDDIKGGDIDYNYQQAKGILQKEITGAKQDMVILNSALGLHVSQAMKVELLDCIEQLKQYFR